MVRLGYMQEKQVKILNVRPFLPSGGSGYEKFRSGIWVRSYGFPL